MIVLAGSASKDLVAHLASDMKAKLVHTFFKKFPDGEDYVRVEGNLRNENVVIVHTTGPPQNERMMQLFLMASTVKNQGAQTITAVIPYLAYSRQDKVFLPGEAFSIKTIVKILETCGVHKILTVSAHCPAALKSLSVPVEDISAIPLLAEHFKSRGFKNAVSLSMGQKGLVCAREAACILEGKYDFIPTRRDRHTGKVRIEEKILDVKGKDAILFDDVISTGGTMAKAVAHAKSQGASRVYAACVHPLLIADARKRIIQSGAEEIVGTDTVSSPVSIVSVAPLIAKTLVKQGA